MIIAIDAGNTRIKWGVHDGAVWLSQGAILTSDAGNLAVKSAGWPEAARVVGCNVAGAAVVEMIAAALAPRFPSVCWLQPSLEACGVHNAYEHPDRLGADRWAALIGARVLVSSACLVVCAGTATTVDWLDAAGVFRGGLILPGFDLMRSALASNTAQLPLAEGVFCTAPRNTLDAITTGCLHAQIGAIERMYAGMDDPSAICLLTGGAASRLEPHLSMRLELADNLVLEGLACFATSQ